MPLLLPLAEMARNPPGMALSLLVAGAVIVLLANGVVLRRPVVVLNGKPRSTSCLPPDIRGGAIPVAVEVHRASMNVTRTDTIDSLKLLAYVVA
jgi:hypothetical protein